MIPVWKLRRELGRIGQQFRAVHEAIWEPFAQRRHDQQRSERVLIEGGAVAASGKIAIFLIFQPNGVAASVIETCRHLQTKGFAPLIVSNADLSDADRKRLLPNVWKLAVRPNFGYDFGGYRDGLWVIDQVKAELDTLLILNDSIWFPIFPERDLIADASALACDIAGVNLRHRGDEEFLESYFYYIRKPVLTSQAFRDYWANLRLTANKYKVIRRGERGFSRGMLAAGFRLCGVFDPATFIAKLRASDDETLRMTLHYAAFIDQATTAEFSDLSRAQMSPDWRATALAKIESTVVRYPFYSTFPYAGHKCMGYPILKRSGDLTAVSWRKSFGAAVQAGDIPAPAAPFDAEIRERLLEDAA